LKEINIQRLIQLELSKHGVLTFRNNCGQYKTEQGYVIRYGVGNPGGSDLIGIVPTVITQEMVNKTLGVFAAIEVKTPTGRPTKEQLNFIDVILQNGGIAGICRSPEDARKLVKGRRT
jgi:hypothetical protein